MKFLILVIVSIIITGCTNINTTPEGQSTQTIVPTEVSMMQESSTEQMTNTRSGIFMKVEDRYDVNGSATLENGMLKFSDDFEISNGPDLFVHFGKDGEYDREARIGKLKNIRGEQEYTVPIELNAEDFNEIWVWCRAFGVGFGKVKLN